MKQLTYPFTEKQVRALRAGEAVSITGLVHTGRDKFHKFFADGGKIPVDFRNGALYHCGPVVVPGVDTVSVDANFCSRQQRLGDTFLRRDQKIASTGERDQKIASTGERDQKIASTGERDQKIASTWRVVAAGPTTSVRENPYEPDFIAKSGVRVIIGKGGMNAATLAAMKKYGCVYIQAVGGAAALAAASVKRVAGVDFLEEFGAAEACWHFEMENFCGVVAMDAHGVSLFDEVEKRSAARLNALVSEAKGRA